MASKPVYLTLRETLSPVVESQVLLPASLERSGTELAEWLAMTPIGQVVRPALRSRVQTLRMKAEQQFQVRLNVLPILPWKSRWMNWDVNLLTRSLRKLLVRYSDIELRCRNSHATTLAMKVRAVMRGTFPIVFDCRGDEGAELVGAAGCDLATPSEWPPEVKSSWNSAIAREHLACEADKIYTVSGKLREVLVKRHGVAFDRIIVRPCAVDLRRFPEPQREQARKHLGLTNEFAVCYLGSLEWYQLPDQSLRLFRQIKELRHDAVFLAITTHVERMKVAIREAGVAESDCRIVSVPSEEVATLLPAADVGLLLRSPDPVNEVASPVKFAEYLACGVPVAITPGIGDYSMLVPKENLGFLFELGITDPELYRKLETFLTQYLVEPNALRHRCRQFAVNHLSWQSQVTCRK